jgi:hypothetical protein
MIRLPSRLRSGASKMYSTNKHMDIHHFPNLDPQMPHTRYACAVMSASATAANMSQAEYGRHNGPAHLPSNIAHDG